MIKTNNTILVICGPTASGKTSLALAIAKELISESSLRVWDLEYPLGRAKRRGNLTPQHTVNLLSADSRQVYKELDIITGKDIPGGLSPAIRIYGLNLVSTGEAFNLVDYTAYASKIINRSIREKIPLIIVGGTGLYLKAITSKLLDVNIPPDKKLREKLEKLDVESLRNMFLRINPEKFHVMNNSDAHNPRRLIRAIEIASSPSLVGAGLAPARNTTSSRVSYSNRGNPSPLDRHASLAMTNTTFLWIGLKQDKVTQRLNILHRVIERLETGAISEVKSLLKKYSDHDLPIFSSLGVKQILEYLNNNITREELIERWTNAENDYARRQMVWFQKQPDVIWYDKCKVNNGLISKLAKVF